MRRNFGEISRRVALTLALAAMVGSTGCSRGTNGTIEGGDGNVVNNACPADTTTNCDPNSPLPGADHFQNVLTGQNGDTTITPTDNLAAQEIANGIDPINPANQPISNQIQQEIKTAVQDAVSACDDKHSADCSKALAERYNLIPQILDSCAKTVAGYDPLPGEPLLGTWNFSCLGKKQTVTVTGDYDNYVTKWNTSWPGMPKSIPVSANSSAGLGQFAASGKGINGSALHWSFRLNDNTGTPAGHLFNYNNAAGTKCNADITLPQPNGANPIPAKYRQGMKMAQACYRDALMLQSPLYDALFTNMDPAVAGQLILSVMGLN